MAYPLWRWLAFVAVNGFLAGLLTGAPFGSTPDTVSITSSANPSVFGQPVSLVATVSPAAGQPPASGRVTVYDGVTVLGIRPLANGQAVLTTRLLASGQRSIEAYYSGDSRYAPNLSAGVAQTVNALPEHGFQSAVNYPAGSYPFSIAVGDFNGDGIADLAVASPGDPAGVSVLFGNGDGTFQPPINCATSQSPWFVAVGDFNGDGQDDLVVANRATNNVSVLLGNGDGTFQPAVNYATGGMPWSIAVADFNGDGLADIVVSNYGVIGNGVVQIAGSASVLLGNGDGTFQPAVNYITGGQASSVAVGDFNHDGRPDFAVVGPAFNDIEGYVDVFLGNGDGTFQPPLSYEGVAFPNSVAVADFNGDGQDDLVTSGPYGLLVLLGNGNGSFQVKGSPAAGVAALTVGDFNGDGISDLAFIRGNSLIMSLGNGDGTFQPVVTYPIAGSIWSMAVGDFNGDGSTDLALANSTGDTQDYVSVVLGTQGLGVTASLISSPNPSTYGQSVTLTATISPAAGVLAETGSVTFFDGATALGKAVMSNGNAMLDVNSLATGTHTLTAVYGGDVNYGTAASAAVTQTVNLAPETTTLTSSANPSTYGQNVILTATISPAEGSGTVAFHDGVASLGVRAVAGGQSSLSIATLTPGSHSLTADYSGDQNHAASTSSVLTQLIQGTATTPTVVLTSTANPATFGQSIALTANTSPAAGSGSVTFYDGMTLLGASAMAGGRATLTTSLLPSGTRSLRAYYGGNASYTPATSASITQTVNTLPSNGFRLIANSGPGSNPSAMAVGDFNGDGKADVAVADSKTGNVSVLLGNGDGTFQSAITLPVGGSPNSVVMGDFNGDGHTDLAVSNGNNVSVLLGNGDGTFQDAVQYAAGVSLMGLAVGDFNGDGKGDLAVVNTAGVSVLIGNGDGTFQAAVNVSVAGGNAIATGDLNGDGTADLVVVGTVCELNMLAFCEGAVPGPVSVLLGNGDGTFQTSLINPFAGGQSVVIGDFNGDGKADLAIGVAGTGAKLVTFGEVEVLLGRGDGTFQPAVNYAFGNWVTSIAAGDFNGDGKTDLAIASNGVTLLLGMGDGTFPSTDLYNSSSQVIAVGSFNGDGRTDLAGAMGNGVDALLGVMASVPSINVGGVVNAATLAPGPLVPGSIATVYGSFPTATPAAAAGSPLPTRLAGLSIQFGNGLLAPLFSASGNQVNFQVPWEMSGQYAPSISATLNGAQGFGQTVSLALVGPGIFSTNSQGTGQGAILDPTYRLVDVTNPASEGSVVQIYCTGLGPVTNQPASGAPALSDPLSTTQYPVTVTIGGAPAFVLFAGLTPGAVGLYQVNARVPSGASKGAAVPVEILITLVGTARSNTVTMAIQ